MAGSIIFPGKMSVECCYGAAVWPFTVPTFLISNQGVNVHFASGKFSSLNTCNNINFFSVYISMDCSGHKYVKVLHVLYNISCVFRRRLDWYIDLPT